MAQNDGEITRLFHDATKHTVESVRRSSFPPSTPGCRCATRKKAASHADPRTTMRYDRARVSLDRHATYIVATFLAGASR